MAGRQRQTGPAWSQVWQMPTLLAGVLLLFLGIYLAIPPAKPFNVAAALDNAHNWLEANEPDQADRVLTELEPHLASASDMERARHRALRADHIYLKQRAEQWNNPENHERIVRFYQAAREAGLKLTVPQLQRWAQTLITLKRESDALQLISEIPSDAGAAPHTLVRRLIEQRLAEAGGQPVEPTTLAALLERYKQELRRDGDRTIRRQGMIWAAALETQLLLDANAPDQALNELMIRYQRLNAEGGDADLAPLLVKLGRAEFCIGNYDNAQRHYMLALERLERQDALTAEALVGLAEVEQAGPRDNRTALGYYNKVVSEYPATSAYLRALIGQADCKAKLGDHPEAVDDFAQAIDRLREAPATDPRRELVTNIVRSLYEMNFDRQEYELALDYLTLLQPLYASSGGLPANLLLDLAVTHQRLAEQRQQSAQQTDNLIPISEAARALAHRQAAEHFVKAGDYYLAHTEAVTLIDDEQYGSSLWQAAQCYDAAQLWNRSVAVYLQYITTRSTDPLYLQAIRRLGMARMAAGQYLEAAERFEELVERHSRTMEAYASLVPLARCYAKLGRTNDAIRVLEHVVTNHESITPASQEYQAALIELGRIYHAQRSFEEAIARLTEALQRYNDGPMGATLRFLLADSHRQSSDQLAQDLTQVLPENREASLRAAKVQRLETALKLFDEVVKMLDERDPATMSELEKLYHRNAYFYRADCAFDLGRYEQAIGLYDQAARRWERDPASLVALVQIVNANCELGRIQEAQIANERARWHLKHIPDSAFEDKNLPMNRKHWQDWLRWTNELNLFDTSAAVTNVSNARQQ